MSPEVQTTLQKAPRISQIIPLKMPENDNQSTHSPNLTVRLVKTKMAEFKKKKSQLFQRGKQIYLFILYHAVKILLNAFKVGLFNMGVCGD